MDVYINIPKKYLFFREEARVIFREVLAKKKIPKSIYLDFSGVSFFSRSFVDELLNIINDLSNKKIKIVIQNLKPQLRQMLNSVRRTKIKIQEAIVQKHS